MKSTEKWLYFLMEGSQVVRFHSRPTLKPITDGQHQHGVAIIVNYLVGEASHNLLMAALTHDMAEQAAGDVPSPTKRALGVVKSLQVFEDKCLSAASMNYYDRLTTNERAALYLADQFEGMLSCVRERFYGNCYVCLPYKRWRGWVMEQGLYGASAELAGAIHSLWQLADAGGAPEFDVFEEVAVHA